MKLFGKAMIATVAFFAVQNSWANVSTVWDRPDLIPAVIKTVQVDVFDLKRETPSLCKDSECFRADIYLNDIHIARWRVSPGRPHYGTEFVGGYTPAFEARSYHPSHLHQHYKNRFGDSMPWAAFIKNSSGGKSGYATHCGHVTGRRESHGCIRMVCTGGRNDAKTLNLWIREAFKNGGSAKIWTRHTRL
ncbi:MAG: L,D-transpeptidase [Bdellovibrionaceae bacterium]|nr:L,D-transpeptidase [Pseudobdellovibrionaceae bacterium]